MFSNSTTKTTCTKHVHEIILKLAKYCRHQQVKTNGQTSSPPYLLIHQCTRGSSSLQKCYHNVHVPYHGINIDSWLFQKQFYNIFMSIISTGVQRSIIVLKQNNNNIVNDRQVTILSYYEIISIIVNNCTCISETALIKCFEQITSCYIVVSVGQTPPMFIFSNLIISGLALMQQD